MIALIDRDDAVAAIAGAIADRHSFVIVAPPDTVAGLAGCLTTVAGWTGYLDNGTPTVLCTDQPAAATVLDGLAVPTAMVVTVPKTVPAATLGEALGQEIPADGSQDLVLLCGDEEGPLVWPLLFVDALAPVDPRAAAALVRRRDTRMTAATGHAVLAADELLCSPDRARIVAELRRRIPTAELDQLDAATRHVHLGLMATVVEGRAASIVALPPGEHSAWARLGALTALATWLAGQGSTCIHDPQPSHPQPILAAAWRPGLVVCASCTHLLKLPRNSEADRRCDGCGHLCAGVEEGDPIYRANLALGPLQYLSGACIDCRYWPAPMTNNITTTT